MKICPRCQLVDDGHRRVCVGCRRSLIAAPDLELDEVLEQRARALAAQASGGGAIPWGPALAEPSSARVAVATLEPIVVPDHVPDDFHTGDDLPTSFGDAHDVTDDEADTIDDDDGAIAGPEPDVDALDAEEDTDTDTEADTIGDAVDDPELARATREILVKMYDPRANAAVLVDATTPKPERRARRTEERDARGERVTAARRRSRRTTVVVVLALVASVFAWRAASGAWRDDGNTLADPSTPVAKLPWHDVGFGDIVAQFPGTSVTSTFGDEANGIYTHQRYDLPDITITVISTSPDGVAGNDIALRGIADRLLQSVGGRVESGGVVDTGWGTAFSGRGSSIDGEAYVYVALTRGALVEVRAETPGPAGERAQQIFGRITRSFQPA